MINHENKTVTCELLALRKMIADGFDFSGWTIRDCNLSGMSGNLVGDDVKIEHCAMWNSDLTGDLVLDEFSARKNTVMAKTKEPNEDEIIEAKTSDRMREIKPLAYKNPAAVKRGVYRELTQQEIDGVFGAEE
jgi:hypothetical protein